MSKERPHNDLTCPLLRLFVLWHTTNPLCLQLLPDCCFHVNRNLLSLDSQSEEWFIKRSRVYQTFIEVSAKSFTYSGEMYGFKWSVCLQLPLEYQYFQLNPEKQEVLLQPQIVCLVMELLTEMLIKFDVSPHFLRNKKLMSSCRLHPVLCVINFYDNNQDRKGAFFLLPANINISLCRENGKMGLDRDLLYF